MTTKPTFQGRRVAAFESRLGDALAQLITTYGGPPLVAPSLRARGITTVVRVPEPKTWREKGV